jgi:hypothetical protein
VVVLRAGWVTLRVCAYSPGAQVSGFNAHAEAVGLGGSRSEAVGLGGSRSLIGAAPLAAAVVSPYPPFPGTLDQMEVSTLHGEQGPLDDDSSHARRTMRHYTADAVDPADESDSDGSDSLVFGEGDACSPSGSTDELRARVSPTSDPTVSPTQAPAGSESDGKAAARPPRPPSSSEKKPEKKPEKTAPRRRSLEEVVAGQAAAAAAGGGVGGTGG